MAVRDSREQSSMARDFTISRLFPWEKKYISKQVIENGVSGAYITFLYLIDQFFFFFIRIGICLDIFGFIALDGFTDPGLLKQFFVIF